MKRILFLITSTLLSLGYCNVAATDMKTANSTEDVITQDKSRLPVAASKFLTDHFANNELLQIKIDNETFSRTSYEVLLSDGIEIEFNDKGAWEDIEVKGVGNIPNTVVIAPILKYVSDNFANSKIIKIKREKNTIEVELNNDREFIFNSKGKFIREDY